MAGQADRRRRAERGRMAGLFLIVVERASGDAGRNAIRAERLERQHPARPAPAAGSRGAGPAPLGAEPTDRLLNLSAAQRGDGTVEGAVRPREGHVAAAAVPSRSGTGRCSRCNGAQPRRRDGPAPRTRVGTVPARAGSFPSVRGEIALASAGESRWTAGTSSGAGRARWPRSAPCPPIADDAPSLRALRACYAREAPVIERLLNSRGSMNRPPQPRCTLQRYAAAGPLIPRPSRNSGPRSSHDPGGSSRPRSVLRRAPVLTARAAVLSASAALSMCSHERTRRPAAQRRQGIWPARCNCARPVGRGSDGSAGAPAPSIDRAACVCSGDPASDP